MIKEEAISIQVEDKITLRGRVYREPHAHKPLLILCHGLPPAPAEKKPDPVEEDGGYPALARRCAQALSIPVFHFNFRGTGESGGDFDLSGWRRDLTAFLDYWEQGESVSDFILWGFSAGGAVSACVAASDPRVKILILAASPAGFRELFPPEGLPELLTRFRATGIIRDSDFPPDPAQWLENIYAADPALHLSGFAPRPLLIVHGSGDELIPLRHAFKLFHAAKAGRQLRILPGAIHQLRKEEKAIETCLEWLRGIMQNAECKMQNHKR